MKGSVGQSSYNCKEKQIQGISSTHSYLLVCTTTTATSTLRAVVSLLYKLGLMGIQPLSGCASTSQY